MSELSLLTLFSRMMGLVRSDIPYLAAGMLFDMAKHLITIGIGLLGVFIIFIVSQGSPAGDLLPMGGLMIVLALIRGVCGFFGPYLNHIAAFHIMGDLRHQFYRKIDPLAPAIFITRRTGDLVSIALNNIEKIELFLAHTLTPVIVAVTIPLLIVGVISFIHLYLAITLLFFIILSALVPILTIRINVKRGDRMRIFLADLSSFLIDSVQGIWEILAFGGGKNRLSAMNKLTQEFQREQRTYGIVNACTSASYSLIVTAGIMSVLIEAAILADSHVINPFFLPVTVILSAGAFVTIREIVDISTYLSMTIAGAKRFFAVMDELPVVEENGLSDAKISSVPRIDVSDVWFKYGEYESYVLKGINFSIPSGQTVAVVGMTGAGKTTLINLLMRFWDPEKGNIHLDGNDIRDLRFETLRNSMSIVSQDIFLFNISIRENIRIGKMDATDHEVEEAARFARIHDFISELPDGYETQVGERGIRLSGGERQRIAIARAIIRNAPVLILDEATSNLDTMAELMIRDTIKELLKGRTVFMIAHRLSTVVHADTILVLNQGEIIEQGTHRELVQRGGMYTDLIAAQEI
jgi:ATP-binding cassette, subfamily C, bacterial CydC